MPTLEDLDGKPVAPRIDLGDDPDGDNEPFEQAPPRRTAPAGPPAVPAATPRRGRPPARGPKPDQARVTKTPAAALDDKTRADGVQGLMQVAAGVTLLAGKATGNDAFKADAVAIASVAEETAAACVQIAHSDPKFAAALDRVCAVGPYGALITVAVGLGTQIARNHRPGAKLPGTVHPDELLKAQGDAEESHAA